MVIENVLLLSYWLLWVTTEKTDNDLYLQGAEICPQETELIYIFICKTEK